MECFWSQNGIYQNEDILQERDISAEIRYSSDGALWDRVLACQATPILATGSEVSELSLSQALLPTRLISLPFSRSFENSYCRNKN